MSKHSYEAWRNVESFEDGLGYVVILRIKNDGDITAGAFLVDTYCLGVKEAFLVRFGSSEREEMLERIFPDKPQSFSPACAKKLILDAVAYAQKLGFQPHPDFRRASTLLNGIDPELCETNFEFGKDGKPLYIQGPNDSAEFRLSTLIKLNESCGEGNYAFVSNTGDEDDDLLEALDLVDEEDSSSPAQKPPPPN